MEKMVRFNGGISIALLAAVSAMGASQLPTRDTIRSIDDYKGTQGKLKVVTPVVDTTKKSKRAKRRERARNA